MVVTVVLPPARMGGGFSRARIPSSDLRQTSRFFVGAKNQKLFVFGNFNITFLATWGCASDFLKMLPKFKMAARGQLHFFVGAKTVIHISHDMEM